jgi:anti-sigma B factor antagonist
MTLRTCAVTVKQLPEILNLKHGRIFYDELESCMNINRPCIVLDCSNVRQMDRFAISLLFSCLEEAMKRNGNVKLAAIPSGAEAVLKRTGVTSLFEIFETNAEAVNSFHQLRGNTTSYAPKPGASNQTF